MRAKDIKALFAALATTFEREKGYLGELDTTLGDGDHGVAMARGFLKAYEAIEDSEDTDVGRLFESAGRALMSGVGGASGPLFAIVLLELGKACAGKDELTLPSLKLGAKNAVMAVERVGKTKAGDKTLLDVLLPVSESLQTSNDLGQGLKCAAKIARDSAARTANMSAKKGRAQYVEGAGLGHPDPGATSLAFLFETLRQTYLTGVNL